MGSGETVSGVGDVLWEPQRKLDDDLPVRGNQRRIVELEIRALRADLEVLGHGNPTVKRCALSHMDAVERLVL